MNEKTVRDVDVSGKRVLVRDGHDEDGRAAARRE
jgi:hypothetical protein